MAQRTADQASFRPRGRQFRLSRDRTLDLFRRPEPIPYSIVAGDPVQPFTLTLLQANSQSRFGVLTPTPVRFDLLLDPQRSDETLRLRLQDAGGVADEAEINLLPSAVIVQEVDIITGGTRNHVDLNLTDAVQDVVIRGNASSYLDFDFAPLDAHPSAGPLRIDARRSQGLTAVFLGDYRPTELLVRGARSPASTTLLGLQPVGDVTLSGLRDVDGLILQKGSTGELNLRSNRFLQQLEVQPLGERPGEDHALTRLHQARAIQSIRFVGSGEAAPQRFPGLELNRGPGPAGTSGRRPLSIGYDNRGLRLGAADSLSHADPLILNGVRSLRLDARPVLGHRGAWSIPGIAGRQLQHLTVLNRSQGSTDLGLITHGSPPGRRPLQGRLRTLEFSRLQGSVQLMLDTTSLQRFSTVRAGDGGLALQLQSPPVRSPRWVTSGDGDDRIGVGPTRQTIHSGVGRDRFVVVEPNRGEINHLLQLDVDDPEPSDDAIVVPQSGVNQRTLWLDVATDLSTFQRQARAQSRSAPSAAGLYLSPAITDAGAVTWGYFNSSGLRDDLVFALQGDHAPVLQGQQILLG